MRNSATSKNGVAIRLSDERWSHIAEEHGELEGLRHRIIEAVEYPERIVEGREGALIAVRSSGDRRWLVVVYREMVEDGFVITAFLTTRRQFLEKRRQLWP